MDIIRKNPTIPYLVLHFMLLWSVLGSDVELSCPSGYVVQGTAVYTREAKLHDVPTGFLLCIVCEASYSYVKDSLDVCLSREFYDYAKFTKKVDSWPVFVTDINTLYAYRYAESKNNLFNIVIGENEGKMICGIAFHATNASISGMSQSYQVIFCQGMTSFPYYRSKSVWCQSPLRLSGIVHFLDRHNWYFPSSCGLCSVPGSSKSEVYVCRNDIERSNFKDLNSAYYKCLRKPCEGGIDLQLDDNDVCGFQLDGKKESEFHIIQKTVLLSCNETEGGNVSVFEPLPLGWQPDVLHFALGIFCAILLVTLIVMTYFKYLHGKHNRSENETADGEKVEQMEMKSGEKIVSECVEHNVYYE